MLILDLDDCLVIHSSNPELSQHLFNHWDELSKKQRADMIRQLSVHLHFLRQLTLAAALNHIQVAIASFGAHHYVNEATAAIFDGIVDTRLIAAGRTMPDGSVCKDKTLHIQCLRSMTGHPKLTSIIFVDDLPRNVQAASKMGIKTLLVNPLKGLTPQRWQSFVDSQP